MVERTSASTSIRSQTGIEIKARILLIDDDPITLEGLGRFLELEGYEVETISQISDARRSLKCSQYNLVITDVSLPDGGGFDLLREIRVNHKETVVILLTANGTIESAVEAIRQGAYDYLTKPIIDDDVRMSVDRALQQQSILAENSRLKRALSDRFGFQQIIGQDHRMSKVFDLMEAVADSPTTVLITGESGTGKSLIARAIHTRSSRCNQPFVEVACGALPETLLENELFGHVRGAFTDAVSDKLGKFAAAAGGTIFLDEIATASPQLQIKLLRVLQERQFEPVGSNETKEVDVRVILATNRDLRAEVEAGRFRKDLYYRINVVNIELPPLRDRIGDIPLLAEKFFERFSNVSSKRILGFSTQAIERIQRYSWPGNVRELENCVERAVVLCRSPYIEVDDLPPAVLETTEHDQLGDRSTAGHRTLKQVKADAERQIILAVLQMNGGSRQATAAQLGINRTTLYKKMRRYGLLDL